MWFRKKKEKKTYDTLNLKPVIRASICTSEKVAGFRNIHTGQFQEVMLLAGPDDLEEFRNMYGIQGEIETIY